MTKGTKRLKRRPTNYTRRGSEVRYIPRAPHTHHYITLVKSQGKSVRWKCGTCPAVTRWEPSTRWMSKMAALGAAGTEALKVFQTAARRLSEAVVPVAKPYTLHPSHKPAQTVEWTVDKEGRTPDEESGYTFPVVKKVAIGLEGAVGPDGAGFVVVDADDEEDEGFVFHPGKKYTREELSALLKADVYFIAAELNIKGRSKMTRSTLTDAILDAQK